MHALREVRGDRLLKASPSHSKARKFCLSSALHETTREQSFLWELLSKTVFPICLYRSFPFDSKTCLTRLNRRSIRKTRLLRCWARWTSNGRLVDQTSRSKRSIRPKTFPKSRPRTMRPSAPLSFFPVSSLTTVTALSGERSWVVTGSCSERTLSSGTKALVLGPTASDAVRATFSRLDSSSVSFWASCCHSASRPLR